MILDRVTITGADDKTDPRRLLRLSLEFPFVEWGILLGNGVTAKGGHGFGFRRFPSHSWIEVLVELARHREQTLNLSLHLCGPFMRGAIDRGDEIVRELVSPHIWNAAQRIQLNFHGVAHKVDPLQMAKHVHFSGKSWIFQLDGVNNDVFLAIAEQTAMASPLFDRSGGNGIVPASWPKGISPYCGYAGGLGPHNLEEEISRIRAAVTGSQRVWIDMETYVRSDADRYLDIDKVREALKICQKYVA